MIVFGFLFLSKGNNKKTGIIIITIFILIVLSVGWFGWEPIFERFEKVRTLEGNISDLRIEIWRDSKNIIEDFFLTGTEQVLLHTYIQSTRQYLVVQWWIMLIMIILKSFLREAL